MKDRVKSAVVWLPLLLAGVLTFAGCAVDSRGMLGIDADELTATKLYPFQTAFGNAVLRHTLDGRYQIKLYDRQAIFDVARTDSVQVENVLTINNETYIALRIARPTCQYVYRTLLVKQKEVDHYDLPNDCRTPVGFALEDGHLLAIQQKPMDARFWKMTDTTVISGIVRPSASPVFASPAQGRKVSRRSSAVAAQHRRPLRHKRSDTEIAVGHASDSGAESADAGSLSASRPMSDTMVSSVPRKMSTIGSSNRTPIHIDLDDSH